MVVKGLSAGDRETIGWWVRDMIESSGHTQVEVAAALCFAPKTVWRWCAGTKVPDTEDAQLLCNFLGLDWATEWARLQRRLRG